MRRRWELFGWPDGVDIRNRRLTTARRCYYSEMLLPFLYDDQHPKQRARFYASVGDSSLLDQRARFVKRVGAQYRERAVVASHGVPWAERQQLRAPVGQPVAPQVVHDQAAPGYAAQLAQQRHGGRRVEVGQGPRA